MKKKKIRIGVLFGGRSGEHEVSLVSARSVMSALDPEKYDLLPIGITKEGEWLAGAGVMEFLQMGSRNGEISALRIGPEPGGRSFDVEGHPEIGAPDLIFPVLHGTFGEDGTIQGLLELAGIPYVGAGVVGSAAGMDKILQKYILRGGEIPVVEFMEFRVAPAPAEWEHAVEEIEGRLGYPIFVKPARLGSSVGISKVSRREDLPAAMKLAFSYDLQVIVEKGVVDAREFECAVLGLEDPETSLVGEIISSNEFYDYDAKYVDGRSRFEIPADIPLPLQERIRQLARHAFLISSCEGMARVDFLYGTLDDTLYLNELNTIPGFTSISMYPKLFESSGIPYPELLDRLVDIALVRSARRNGLTTSYRPKRDWFNASAE